MKTGLFVLSAFLFSASSAPNEGKFERLMQDIEKQVRLPQTAKPLEAYVRYYAGQDDGEVVAVYMLPGLDDLPPGEGCEELREDMTTVPCSFAWPKSAEVGAGNRVWLPETSMLPMPMRDAGDCGVVTMVYRSSERRFIEVTCFGQSPIH